jgi:predicted glycoside hydrolase/deacetylase ChbG (UPF0249 family)
LTAAGLLIVNADDWGRDAITTDRALACIRSGAVSSVSAMVFMEDSHRAATIARERGLETALHLNFTTPYSAPHCPRRLLEHQVALARYLRRTRLSHIVVHPGLIRIFASVVAAQLDEFVRLYGAQPRRIDGHHHMHLCANVVFMRLLPAGTLVRRHFSFERGEKSFANVFYRRFVDRIVAQRHRVVDFFYSLTPLDPASRLQRIFSLARTSAVEVETHPINPLEYRFLTTGGLFQQTAGVRLGPPSALQPTSATGSGL